MTQIHVIIPVYNALTFLRETVDSVLNQPYQGIDVVLVDDGSTDGSSALCDELAGKNERVSAIHQKNQGVSAARNTGIEYVLEKGMSTGYIAFLDSDDLWNRNVFTQELMNGFNGVADTEVYVFGNIFSNEDCSRFAYLRMYEDSCFEGGNGVIWKTQGTFCANLYHVNLFRRWGIRFKEGLKYSEDKIFMMQCVFLAKKVRFMPQLLHIYRQNTKSAMGVSRSIAPIDYYVPIIDGWIESDLFLNGYQDQTGKSTDAGFVLASIYFMDMAMEHYMRWKAPKELEAVKCHPYYHLFENMRQNCVTENQYRNHKLLLEHPLVYRIKYNAAGAAEMLARLLLRVKPVRDLRMKRKYSITEIPHS